MGFEVGTVKRQIVEQWPSFIRQRQHAKRLKAWADGEQEPSHIHIPRNHVMSREFAQLIDHTRSPWIKTAINALVQCMYVDGISRPGSEDNLQVWDIWQENGFDARQLVLYRDTLGTGLSFVTVMPAMSRLTGERTAKWRGFSSVRMAAFYDDDDDEWPLYAFEAQERPHPEMYDHRLWYIRFFDDTHTHWFTAEALSEATEILEADLTHEGSEEHGVGLVPVVRYTNLIDLDGRAYSETEPLIPMAARIDQDVFDRLVVQRFGAWKVRWAAGLAKPPTGTPEEQVAIQQLLSDLLVSDKSDTKFGTLDATDMAGFISGHDSDLREFSAVSQVPPHHLLGLSSNMQAESLAAVTAGMIQRVIERQTNFGERHEQVGRISAHIVGNRAEARAFDMQSRWRDPQLQARSLAQIADALSKIAVGLKVPVQMLWGKIPGWTDSDTQRALKLIEDGAVDAALEELVRAGLPDQPPIPMAA